MSKLDKTVAKLKTWVTETSTLAQSIIKKILIEIVCFALASAAAFLIVIYGKAILIIFFELTSLLSNGGMSTDTSSSSKPFEGARNIAFALTALVGGPFLVWRTILADKQTKTAEKQTAIEQEKASLDEQTHYTTLYTKSIELLGAMRVVKNAKGKDVSEPALELRLGAIYALERIARDSEKDHWPIMEVLTAYIRENSPYKDGDKPKLITTDIQAAISVIGRRNPNWIEKEKKEKLKLNLSNSNLTGSDFSDLNYDNAIFIHSSMSNSKFIRTELNDASIENSFLSGAKFNSTVARKINFRDSDLLKTEHDGCNYDGAYFKHSKIENLEFDNCNFNNAEFYLLDLMKTKFYFCCFDNVYQNHATFIDTKFLDCILQFHGIFIDDDIPPETRHWPDIDGANIINCVLNVKLNNYDINKNYLIEEELSLQQINYIFKQLPRRHKNAGITLNILRPDWPALIEEAKNQS